MATLRATRLAAFIYTLGVPKKLSDRNALLSGELIKVRSDIIKPTSVPSNKAVQRHSPQTYSLVVDS
ncbi:hypothetical protein J6590_055416 [Homalodisca vitripennis]|nr:hypothetical protein J6590_055416 [Homalodisca vitripennis]